MTKPAATKVLGGILLLLLLAVAWWFLPVQQWIDGFRMWILSLGIIGVVAFIALYVVLTLVIGPASALTLTAGLAYGAWGFPLVVGSATLAAAIAFLLGRYVARQRVSELINRDIRLQSLNRAVSEEGWRVVGLLRLSPLIPYGLQNYFFAITDVRFVPYVIATLFGIMPATALYVYLGSLGQAGGGGWLKWTLIIGGLVATAMVAFIIGRRAQAIMERHTAQ